MPHTPRYQMNRIEIAISIYMLVGGLIQFAFLFFFGNWFDLSLIFLLGIIFLVIAGVLFFSANVLKTQGGMEEGKGFVTTKLVDTGIYGIIRHPIYLSLAYLFSGFALLSQHPISLFLGFSMALGAYYYMIGEEKLTLSKFGKEYQEYMNKVPRSNLILGLWRYFRR